MEFLFVPACDFNFSYICGFHGNHFSSLPCLRPRKQSINIPFGMFINMRLFEKFQKYQIQQKKMNKQDFDIILIGNI